MTGVNFTQILKSTDMNLIWLKCPSLISTFHMGVSCICNKSIHLIFVIHILSSSKYLYCYKYIIAMRATFPTHQSKNNKSERILKILEGKGYLEIMMYLLAVSASVVILFA